MLTYYPNERRVKQYGDHLSIPTAVFDFRGSAPPRIVGTASWGFPGVSFSVKKALLLSTGSVLVSDEWGGHPRSDCREFVLSELWTL